MAEPPVFDPERVRTVFDDWATRGWADDMQRTHAPFVRRAFDRLPFRRDTWYLDIGCGNGYTVRWAAARAPAGEAVGIDLSPAMVRLARRLAKGLDNVEFEEAQFPERHDLPYGRFDVIFSMEVFYYFPDLGAALQEAWRLLTPGGIFACMVDYYGENVASHEWPADVGLPMTLLDAAGWRGAIEGAGFEIVEQRRIRLPPDEATEPWKAIEGSLLTLGRRRRGRRT